MGEMKDCPFCGSDKVNPVNDIYEKWCVECFECHAQGGEADTEEEAIENWNRRA